MKSALTEQLFKLVLFKYVSETLAKARSCLYALPTTERKLVAGGVHSRVARCLPLDVALELSKYRPKSQISLELFKIQKFTILRSFPTFFTKNSQKFIEIKINNNNK
jgi:hypothetical protein